MRALAPVVLLSFASIAGPACAEATELGEVPAASPVGEPTDAAALADPGPIIVAHAGQGSPADRSDGPEAAADRAFEALARADGGDATDAVAAAIAAIELLEDDPRFNAGTGANLRLDGRTIEADAAVMDDRGRFGAVAGIDGVRHPIRVAEAIVASPHLLLAGAGAQAFAQTLGLEPRDLSTPQARAKLARALAELFAGPEDAGALAPVDPWAGWDWRAHWNFPSPAPEDLDAALARLEPPDEQAGPAAGRPAGVEPETRDTVGVVVRTGAGRYAAALSTGGTTLALRGRVGDVPVLGAGLYAGPHGAVAATGKGEAIMRERVAAEVYRHLAAGATPDDAIRLAIRDISPAEGVGVIAVSERGYGALATSQMAWAARGRDWRERADTRIRRYDRG